MRTKLFILSTLLAALTLSTSFSAGTVKESDRRSQLRKETTKQEGYEPGYGVESYQLMKGYNAPGRINVADDWGFFAGANALYVQPYQEGMQLAEKVELLNSNYRTIGLIKQSFDWTPAFKLQLGWAMCRDKWSLYTEYFHLHVSDSTKASADPRLSMSTLFGNTPYLVSNAAIDHYGVSLKNKWKIDMDFVDLNLTRPFYNGEKLILKPIVGLRAAWITQKTSGSWIYYATNVVLPSSIKSGSFGIGPKFSLNGKWIWGRGFSMLGDITGSVLHTHYKLRKNTNTYVAGNLNPVDSYHVRDKVDYLRPALETELGISWGRYVSDRDWHVELALTYIFNVYWNQNMISNYFNMLTNTGASDLYLHGLNLALRFDF